MVKLASAFSRLKSMKVLVIGDLLLDSYTMGKVSRISPEAPVAVLHVQQELYLPGGAGNVVFNLVSLGAQVAVLGRIGHDWAGDCLKAAFEKEGIETQFLIGQENYRTPVKNRVIADNQQIVRIDHEQIIPLPEQLEQAIIDMLSSLLEGVKVVAISDYGKGFLTSTLLSAAISQARKRGIIVIADPKGQDFSKYYGATIIKPNLSEAYAAAGLPFNMPLEAVAEKILRATQAEILMVTRSEAGISLLNAFGERFDFSVQVKQVKDVTGAGDTVLAMLAHALANELSYHEAIQLCNIAAGIAIERIGCARVSLSDLAHRLLERDVSNKVFDEEHLFALQEILKSRPFTLLALSHINALSSNLFHAIKDLALQNKAVLIYIMDFEPEETLIEILASLKEVDFILLHQESLQRLCEKVTPSGAFLFEEKELKQLKDVEDVLTV